ncbi:hypothetical protein [Staphylococcus simulans]|uniref:hypothetical protein n=1 Tax=Staphylococcus simulans TaxID=1286 RepID=UPI0037448436
MYNTYYFLVVRKGIVLFEIWIVGSITMVLCILSFMFGVILLHKTPSWLKGKNHKDKVESKILVIAILFGISLIVVVEKIIEYILVPNINDSKYMFLVTIGLILISYYNVFYCIYIILRCYRILSWKMRMNFSNNKF